MSSDTKEPARRLSKSEVEALMKKITRSMDPHYEAKLKLVENYNTTKEK